MEGHLLGSGGWLPTTRRETCCALFREGARALLVDAGTGLSRLLERPDLLQGVEHVDIVLTHFHLDHVVGLSYLPALPLPEPPVVWGPGAQLYGLPTHEILERLLGRPLFAAPLASLVGAVREIPSGSFVAAGFEIATRVQPLHADPTLALRLGDAVTYCTDTAFDPENAAFASGSRVLVHEAWLALDTSDDAGHTAAGDAGRVAEKAGAGHLVLVHLDPLLTDEAELVRHARARFEAVSAGEDLARLPVS